MFGSRDRLPGLLSDTDIKSSVDNGEIVISPFTIDMLQPASYEIRLGSEFHRAEKSGSIDPTKDHPNWKTEHIADDATLELWPGQFVLAHTVEHLALGPMMAARVEGKSTLGRYGLLAHATAGFVDPGWSGQLTLELHNLAPWPLKLTPGMKIGQLAFFRLTEITFRSYGQNNHYKYSKGAVKPKPLDS